MENLRNDTVEVDSFSVFFNEVYFDTEPFGNGVYLILPEGDEEREIIPSAFWPIYGSNELVFTQTDANKIKSAAGIMYHGPSDTWGIVVTTGGDVAYTVCSAYVDLGYLPPAQQAAQIEFDFGSWNRRTEKIYQACKRSLELQRAWAVSRLEQLERKRLRAQEGIGDHI